MPNENEPTVAQVEELLIAKIGRGMSSQLGKGPHGIVREVRENYPGESKPSPQVVAQAVWGVIAKELAYLDFSRETDVFAGNPAKWWLYPTQRGTQAADDTLPNPDLPDKYLQRFAEDIPDAPESVQRYVREALSAYGARLYMASAVMLGVAAEGAFLDMAQTFCAWLQGTEAENYRRLLDNPRTSYNVLFAEFRKRVEPRRKELPGEIADNLDVLNPILNLIRKYRNDAGHPTGVEMDRGACFLSLVAFAEAAKRLYALEKHFVASVKAGDENA